MHLEGIERWFPWRNKLTVTPWSTKSIGNYVYYLGFNTVNGSGCLPLKKSQSIGKRNTDECYENMIRLCLQKKKNMIRLLHSSAFLFSWKQAVLYDKCFFVRKWLTIFLQTLPELEDSEAVSQRYNTMYIKRLVTQSSCLDFTLKSSTLVPMLS